MTGRRVVLHRAVLEGAGDVSVVAAVNVLAIDAELITGDGRTIVLVRAAPKWRYAG